MHILAAILGFIGIAFFWWYRLRDVGKVAGEVVNQAGIARGKFKRKAHLKKANMSPITAIDNPLIAAATLMFSTQSEEFVLGDHDEEVIAELLLTLADKEDVEEAIVYARWAISQIGDPKMVIDKLGIFLKSQLSDDEKLKFLDLLEEANTKIGGCYNFAATNQRLANKMGLISQQ